MPCIVMMGKAREALTFYKQIFESDITFTTFEENKDAFYGEVPIECNDLVFRGILTIKKDSQVRFRISVSDSPVMIFDRSVPGGNRDNITFELSYEEQILLLEHFEKLSFHGKINYEPKKMPPFQLSCSFIDQYGICWILNQL